MAMYDNHLAKRSMSLDLNPCLYDYQNNVVLESPDVKMIKLTSPEMEKLILEMAPVSYDRFNGFDASEKCDESVSPIDMEEQERQKLERKRYRNRMAASRCRKRKLERISGLEQKVHQLKGENDNLSHSVSKLREHICHLKQEVMDHINHGCEIIPPNHH